MSSRRCVGPTALTAVLTATLALAACSSDDTAGAPEPAPTTSSPTTSSGTTAPPPEPTAPATEEPPPLDALDWRSPSHVGQPIDLRRYRGGFLGVETRGAARLTADGRDVWRWSPPTKDDVYGAFVGDDLVAVEYDVRRGDHEVAALDARTGRELWTAPSDGYATQDDQRVYAPSCEAEKPYRYGGGDCTLTAYDARTGSVLWTNPLGTYTEYVFAVGDSLLVQAFRDGARSSFLLLDAATGALRDSDVDDEDPEYTASPLGEDRVVVVHDDDRGRDGCRPTVTTYDTSGTPIWSTTLRTRPGGTGKGACEELYALAAGRDVVVGSGASPAYLLDGRTGKQRWRSTASGFTETATAKAVVLTDDATRETVAIDVRTGEELWRIALTGGGWDASGRYLATNTECSDVCDAVVVDARTGEEALRVPGVPQVYVDAARPGGPTALMVRIDDPESYRADYGFVTLPRL